TARGRKLRSSLGTDGGVVSTSHGTRSIPQPITAMHPTMVWRMAIPRHLGQSHGKDRKPAFAKEMPLPHRLHATDGSHAQRSRSRHDGPCQHVRARAAHTSAGLAASYSETRRRAE